MKRKFLALLTGVAVFGAVFAAAAALNINGGSLQSGTDPSLTCDTGTPAVNLTYDVDEETQMVETVTVNGIADGCEGGNVDVDLDPTSLLGAGTASIPTDGNTDDADILVDVVDTPAADVTDAFVTIHS